MQVFFGEGDEDFAVRAAHDEQRNRAGGAVYSSISPIGIWLADSDVNECAADEVADVGFVFG